MQDRISRYPGRVRLTPVSGQANVYDMELADSPSVAGTPLNKANLLTDATATAMGLTSSATPNTAFARLRTLITTAQSAADSANTNANGRARIITGSYVGTGTVGEDSPTSITIGATPKIVIIIETQKITYFGAIILGTGPVSILAQSGIGSMANAFGINVTSFSSTVSWYAYGDNYTHSSHQLNYDGDTYRWLALV